MHVNQTTTAFIDLQMDIINLFVTRTGIDGYSRLIVYMECSINNEASTALNTFCHGVQRYGLPSRVCCDHGRENTQVARKGSELIYHWEFHP